MEQKVRKTPMRQCLGCNEHKPKVQLLRVVRPPEGAADGRVFLDFTGKKSGRGAYLCRDVKCLRKVRKSRRLETSLNVSIPEEVWNDMEKEIESACAEDNIRE